MLALIGMLVKCGYDDAKRPKKAKSELLRLYPEIECRKANVTKVENNDAVSTVTLNGDRLCLRSLRSALIKRNYIKGSTISDWKLRDAYTSQNAGDPTTMFDFGADGTTVRWIRIWS